MNKKNNRKGFTIVELVIVIAVIAILATVLVPTFGNVIAEANRTALIQEIKNEHTNYTVKHAKDADYSDNIYILIDDTYYEFVNGSINMADDDKTPEAVTPTAGAKVWNAANDTLETYGGSAATESTGA